jgi:bifunctional oligoribonuclease and PAP phosphatase NrnA
MPIDWRPFVELVSSKRDFLLTTHVRPDGDGLGSQKALAAALRRMGKQVRVVNPSHLPARYDFLDPERTFQRFTPPGEEWRDADALIILDTGTWNQLADMAEFVRRFQGEKMVIDHHQTQDDLGARRFVDTAAEATGRLVYEAIRDLGLPLTTEIANALFVALAMDTGWFRHSNVTADTLTLASDLTRAGADPDGLYRRLFEQNALGRLKLMGRVLDRMTVSPDGKIAHSSIQRGDYLAVGATPPDSEDMVNFTLGIAGVEVGLLFMEQPQGGIKVSFRSHGYDVARVAEQFGGGGHRQAAGATLQGTLEDARQRVLKAITW